MKDKVKDTKNIDNSRFYPSSNGDKVYVECYTRNGMTVLSWGTRKVNNGRR